jgi:hypothetical protein
VESLGIVNVLADVALISDPLWSNPDSALAIGKATRSLAKALHRIVTLMERKSGLLRIRRVASGEADPSHCAILKALHPIKACVHTLTWDNGSEFAEHGLVDIALNATSYFADRSHPASLLRGHRSGIRDILIFICDTK